MIEDLYPNIPINFANAEVVKITDIKEVKYSEVIGQRECSATVQNTSGTATPIALTISEKNGQFYFQVRFASF